MLAKELQPKKAPGPMLALQLLQLGIVIFFKELQSWKAKLPISVTESGMVILSKELQPAKALDPISATESGMVMLFNELQPVKAFLPISVTESGMVMLSKELQPLKASHPISVTESGMVMLSKELQPVKAWVSISVTEVGIVMPFKELQPAKALYPISATESGMVMLFNELQPVKAFLPILATEWGMVMLVKELQPLKAFLPISVTESGMVMLSKELQPVKAFLPIWVTESGMVTFTNSVQSLKASLETFVAVWGIFTWQKPWLRTALFVAASISFRLYMTVTSDSACNAACLSVWASFSKQLPCKTSTWRIFCSTGSPGDLTSRSIRFSCSTVWIFLTSSVKTPPCKVFTCNSHRDMAAWDQTISKIQGKLLESWHLPKKAKCMMSDFMLMAQNWNACGICKHYLCIQIIILELEDWLSSNQEVGTSPFLICDFTLLLNTAGSSQVQSVLGHWDRNNLVHSAFLVGGWSPPKMKNTTQKINMDVSENSGFSPQIMHGLIGFSIIFTIHFGVFPPFFLEGTHMELTNIWCKPGRCVAAFSGSRAFLVLRGNDGIERFHVYHLERRWRNSPKVA